MSAALRKTTCSEPRTRVSDLTRLRPRVLHLITSFEVGGTERQAVELLKRLDCDRYDVKLAALRNEGPFYREIEALFPGVPEFPLTSFYNANAFKQFARLRRLMLREEIDILHAHDFYSGLIGAVAARLSGVRVIACQRHLKLSDRRVHEWGTRLTHRFAHRVLVNSEAIRDRIIEQRSAPLSKIVVIRNGVAETTESHAKTGNRLRRELGLDAGVRIVGMVARMQPVKGHRFFIEAAARVASHQPDVHFVLIGDGPLRAEIEAQIANAGITNRVHLLGDRQDVAPLVNSLDLLVLASLHEGSPNAVMEAMAAGVPVVATAVGGARELILDGETGYLAPPSDASALAERLVVALRDEANRAGITTAARGRVSTMFGMRRMVDSVEKLYDELMMV